MNIPQILLVWFQCSPVDALWDPARQTQCDHRKSVYYTYFVGAIAAISDFYLAIVPIHMLLPLRIDPKLKWGLSFLMGCGVFAGVAAIVRTWAAKFILTEDSSCMPLPLFIFQWLGTNDLSHRRCWHPFPLGRSRRMARPHHHVHSTRVASLPSLHFQIHQIERHPKPAALQLQLRLQLQLQAALQHDGSWRPVAGLPASQLRASSHHYYNLHLVGEGCRDNRCFGGRVPAVG